MSRCQKATWAYLMEAIEDAVQGYLTYKKAHTPRTLLQAFI
jgi:hypothetical protein